jgi:hypothetical protein
MSDLDGYVFDEDEDDGQPIDPHDTLADPDRRQRVWTREDPRERDEREAEAILSDFGARPLRLTHARRREED